MISENETRPPVSRTSKSGISSFPERIRPVKALPLRLKMSVAGTGAPSA